jgi:hypothetical protein
VSGDVAHLGDERSRLHEVLVANDGRSYCGAVQAGRLGVRGSVRSCTSQAAHCDRCPPGAPALEWSGLRLEKNLAAAKGESGELKAAY